MASRAREIGEDLEYRLVTGADDLRLVGDGEAEWYDAEADDGTPMEVKVCAIRIPDGTTTRRGRFFVKRAAHEQLMDADGGYLFAVYGRDHEVLATRRVDASEVEKSIPRWMEPPDDRTFDLYAQFSWRVVFDPSDVE